MRLMSKFTTIALAAATAALIWVGAPARAEAPQPEAKASPAALPQGTPKEWDTRIPLPPGAEVAKVLPPGGVVHSVEFTVAGSYDKLVKFYEEQLPKHGFSLGPKVKNAARKVYNLNFSSGGNLDSVSIYPTSDPSRFTVKISYEAK
jgi:hypothetical protein